MAIKLAQQLVAVGAAKPSRLLNQFNGWGTFGSGRALHSRSGLLWLVGCFWASTAMAQDSATVSFSRDIRPILAKNCWACHGPDEATREGSLALHTRDAALESGDSGEPGIVPTDPAASELIRRVTSSDEGERMPPAEHAPALTPEEVKLLEGWIVAGAPFETHWAYAPLSSAPPPADVDAAWVRNDLDRFVATRWNSQGLSPTPPAPPDRLLRRLYLDLIGVPPTAEEVRQYLADSQPDRYERWVERLLADPRYGEHWARPWLDMARYADSQGYAQDEIREIWSYRDWVIQALNADLSYRQFSLEQLAGDLLPNPTPAQMIATAFHRNTMTNTEGGTDDEEFRHAAVVDRVNTTGTIWLGTTLGCAQCHTHKYDPVTHQNYYEIFAIFNQTEDRDQPDNSPLWQTFSAEQMAQREALEKQIAELQAHSAATSAPEEQQAELTRLRNELNSIRPVTTPIMRELPADRRRTTQIAIGGAFSNKGLEVQPNFPLPDIFPPRGESRPLNRLTLTEWLFDEAAPLTARVAVNRTWEQVFGSGLVTTLDDFGNQGELPSHPELLDWLAAEFQNQGWSFKSLLRTIVHSATYQQESIVSPQHYQRDPQNRWLARGTRYRLSAEQIRDSALSISGLLSPKMYGPPVLPPQPKLGLNAAFGGSLDWDPSPGEDRYRRGIYTRVRRTHMYPSFLALDATNRTVCTVRRIRTNTPVGAFVTLNDPVFMECAQAWAQRLAREASNESLTTRLASAFLQATCRQPTADELQELQQFWENQQREYENDLTAAQQLAGLPPTTENTAPNSADVTARLASETAAWTLVCQILLNLDEVLTRN